MLLCLFLLNKILLLLLLLLLSPLLLSCRQFHSNGYMSTHLRNIKKIRTSRKLCEYDKYKANYDNDPEMKEVIEKYNERLAIRWKEYDELKKEKERKYKEQYDKDIKEIILKGKIEKQLTKQLSALDKFTDIDDLAKDIYEKRVATKAKKGKKYKKTLGHTLSEWNILPNIDMYEWIPFSSKEAKIDCNIKNMKHALTKVGYIGRNKYDSLGNKNGNDTTALAPVFSSIMSSSNAFIQRYMGDDITSNGSSFKNSTVSSIFLYALWEFFEHIVAPTVAPFLFGTGDHGHGSQGESAKTCKCVCTGEKTCCCAGTCTNGVKCVCNGGGAGVCTGKCVCEGGSAGVCAGVCKCTIEKGFLHNFHEFLHSWEVFCDAIFALYIIASILVILYNILKYYREIKMEKKHKYFKILHD
ncbi:PIR protein [Plasmodium sp. gorilla clade G2]|uniref:PIR protein n=1 Tax=Plasmodium sp. gorilla clade G2 TaxID=880535 RepID=UPI000D21D13E|nr:PIR protein [Plasmodium sp. gorilla clade G2]SOV11126.1 PIR protein [Plasmodium sp. gorilla clade G2]